MHGTYQTVPDLWPSPLPLCTVHTRQYLTSDPAHYRYARYIPVTTWPLTQPVTVMHGTYQSLPDLWPSPLPWSLLLTVNACRKLSDLHTSSISQQLAVGTLDDLWQLVSFMVEQRLRGELHNYRIQNVNCQLRSKRNLSFPLKLSHRTIEGTGWYSCLMNCGTGRKVEGSITNGVTGIIICHYPSGRTTVWGRISLYHKWEPVIFRGGEGSRSAGLTTLSFSCADYLPICDPHTAGNLRSCPACNGLALTYLYTKR